MQPVCYLVQLMATKMENRVGVNFAIFRSTPWRQFIELLEICCKDTNIHESMNNKISDFWLHKAQHVRVCHIQCVHVRSYAIILSSEICYSKILERLINIPRY